MMAQDTIVAISTPLGEGGIGIVRLSGPEAISIVEPLFRPSGRLLISRVASHTVHHGFIVSQGKPTDEVLITVMRAPRTYTREDVVEINCHGGIVATRAVLDLTLKGGARLAERGEFTKRAFLNGRISLDQAKAVLDVVKAKTQLGLEAAVDRLGGRFTSSIAALRKRLGELLARVEVEINFPDVETDCSSILAPVHELSEGTKQLLTQAEQGRIVREGLTLAIVGRPNVGKSTLLNLLLKEERAIVTPLPGTTRDTVEEEVSLEGIPVRLIDTAGLREAGDVMEEAGVRRTELAIERADALFLVFDRSEPLTEEDRALLREDWGKPTFLILNKADLPRRIENRRWTRSVYEICAKTGNGVDRLFEALLEQVLEGGIPSRNAVLLLDTWERDLLRRTQDCLGRTIKAVQAGCTWDMIAEELRGAYTVVAELQGIDIGEEILDQIFSHFCVGK